MALLTLLWISGAGPGPLSGPAKVQAEALPENGVIVYQFHRRFRCDACYKLEEAISEALRIHFREELKTGSLVFKVIDLDAEENGHYEKDYNFFYNTVIVVDRDQGRDLRFKNLEEIWSLVDDKDAAMEFIRSAVAAYL